MLLWCMLTEVCCFMFTVMPGVSVRGGTRPARLLANVHQSAQPDHRQRQQQPWTHPPRGGRPHLHYQRLLHQWKDLPKLSLPTAFPQDFNFSWRGGRLRVRAPRRLGCSSLKCCFWNHWGNHDLLMFMNVCLLN